ncbi:dihydrodipicolinate synthase family protein [Actinomadura logoneensis]|uniref:Dihydrodipicolinate synthase family protein n=1 Tax=Actinomadura logoneensis TaxID=2293572 RepID=A0A372JKG7_9ACTN|nr:dihydrodipicolinate synthase family protein [Actinomadura logoneensis]RFU39818.1 dihydrodipicolinate synthase family protein [Actinomadura logoneensis]
MDRNSVAWRGYIPAAPTPFTAGGAVDEAALVALMNHYVTAGVHGVMLNGSAGEWYTQTRDERRCVAEVAVDAVAGRIPVIIGCTAFTAAAAIELARDAQAAGADGILFTPPPYAHPTQEEILHHYRLIDAEVELPMVAYNWPRGTAVEIEVDTAAAIAELEHVVAFKCSTANTDLVLDYVDRLSSRVRIFAALISPRGLAVLNGLGGDGYIDGGGIGAPFAVPFFESLWAGDLDAAREYGRKWSEFTRAWIEPDFGGRFAAPASQLKAAMRLLGQPGGEVRQPQLPLTDPEKLSRLESVLRSAGLLG